MGFKDLFFKDEKDETQVDNKTGDSKPNETKNVVKPQVNQPITQPINTGSVLAGQVQADTLTALKELIANRNLPGPDYFELKNAVDALKAAIPEESTRFVAAYATLKSSTPTLTKSYIIESIDSYINVMNEEKQNVASEFETTFKNEIGTRQTLIETTKASIEAKKEQIAKLTEEINAANTLIGETNIEIINRQADLNTQKANFDTTIETVISELNSDKLKINTLITE